MLKAQEIAVSVIQDLSEVNDDPQMVANQMMTQFEQSGFGTVKAIQEVVQELGYSPEEIKVLKQGKVVV